MPQVRAHLEIYGRVQGVFFRDSTRRRARELGVSGWVKNCPDGSVEVLAEGEEDAVRQLIDWCRRGPEYARVDDLRLTWEEFSDEFPAFTVRGW